MMRWTLLLSILMLAGCTSVSDPFLETGAITPAAPAIATEVSPDFAAAYLPAVAGSIEGVRQTARKDYLDQQIVYANATALAGENVLHVTIGRPASDPQFLRAPSRREILTEMKSAVTGVAMAIEPVIGENVHGVYGYATGDLGKGGSCLYAWQFAKRISPTGQTVTGKLSSTHYAAQVRLRYCTPTIPRERIAAVMAGMRLRPVTAQTFDMLQYVSGSGAASRTPSVVVAETPALRRETSVSDVVVEERRPVRREIDDRPTEVASGVQVPMPEGTETREERPRKAQVAVVATETTDARDAAAVPLPDSLDVAKK
jgi:hypothetical protein